MDYNQGFKTIPEGVREGKKMPVKPGLQSIPGDCPSISQSPASSKSGIEAAETSSKSRIEDPDDVNPKNTLT